MSAINQKLTILCAWMVQSITPEQLATASAEAATRNAYEGCKSRVPAIGNEQSVKFNHVLTTKGSKV